MTESLKLIKPLDRHSLSQIPTSGEKVQILGPYTFEELLQEPDHEVEMIVDYRDVPIEEAEGVSKNSAWIEVTRKSFSLKTPAFPDSPGEVTMKSRYLFRRDPASPIEGVVTLHVTYFLHGVRENYTAACKKVIHEVYVKPASQGQGIARILLAVVFNDAPDVMVSPHFSADGARLFGFDTLGKRVSPSHNQS